MLDMKRKDNFPAAGTYDLQNMANINQRFAAKAVFGKEQRK
jgi:hypothetical protein